MADVETSKKKTLLSGVLKKKICLSNRIAWVFGSVQKWVNILFLSKYYASKPACAVLHSAVKICLKTCSSSQMMQQWCYTDSPRDPVMLESHLTPSVQTEIWDAIPEWRREPKSLNSPEQPERQQLKNICRRDTVTFASQWASRSCNYQWWESTTVKPLAVSSRGDYEYYAWRHTLCTFFESRSATACYRLL